MGFIRSTRLPRGRPEQSQSIHVQYTRGIVRNSRETSIHTIQGAVVGISQSFDSETPY